MLEHYYLWVSISILVGFFMAFAVGANDVANSMGRL